MTLFSVLAIISLVVLVVSILGMVVSVLLNRHQFPGEVEDLSGEGKVGRRFILKLSLWEVFTSVRGGDLRYLPFVLFFISMYGFWFFFLLMVSETLNEQNPMVSVLLVIAALLIPVWALRQVLKPRAARSRVA